MVGEERERERGRERKSMEDAWDERMREGNGREGRNIFYET